MRRGETHSFNVDVACAVGTNAAVLYNHIAFWCRTNCAKGVDEMNVDGHWWTTFSVKDAAGLYPYMTERQVGYAIKKLVDSGFVVEGNHNGSKWDHRKWYRIADDDGLETKPKAKKATRANKYADEVAEVIEYLNLKAGTNYETDAESHAKYIRARLSDGRTVEQLKAVIDLQTEQWSGTEWERFLQPSTLFRPKNFDNYIGQINKRPSEKVNKYGAYAGNM